MVNWLVCRISHPLDAGNTPLIIEVIPRPPSSCRARPGIHRGTWPTAAGCAARWMPAQGRHDGGSEGCVGAGRNRAL